ncbi:MAG: GlcNAc-PI de-N-acetylase family [Parcubacteria group bacterium Gr01-1014_48]|nr:MAG: GlcNAc-PI de-N-acetylase family [Parcubacteria group bacterium Greene0416_14]TSC73221.1 MAG: GlcNAc-PI de-N-acetylase family [Parcubacteria group bacterium Gr01-1014_48]TSD00485.1 MAG: GlcNAc-PI de-N-acetylase family [Parcubacteria group bacterium Greene1014_15]TSD08380.1 MAG: GlcNAc-PI de-N-acetylase family [Parcubacteria group bacterium Greene0714_4]
MNKKEKKKFLVFSAHPDDLDFGCAATVAKLTHEGHEVVYCVITNGEKGIHKINHTKQQMVKLREKEQCAAGAAVGVHEVLFLRQTDGNLEHTSEVRKKVIRVIREVKPHVILSQDPGNQRFDSFYRFHRDHRITAEIVFDAIYPAAGSKAFFPELISEKVHPHQIEEVWFYGTDHPNLFVNITNTIEKKIEALRCHDSQFHDFDNMAKHVYQNARTQGKKKKMTHAEGFRRLTF